MTTQVFIDGINISELLFKLHEICFKVERRLFTNYFSNISRDSFSVTMYLLFKIK